MFYSFPGPRKKSGIPRIYTGKRAMAGIQIPEVGCKHSCWGCSFILHSHGNYRICLRVGLVLCGNKHKECNHMKHLDIKIFFFYFLQWGQSSWVIFNFDIFLYVENIHCFVRIVFIGVFKTRHKGTSLFLAIFGVKKKPECRTEYLQIDKFIPWHITMIPI